MDDKIFVGRGPYLFLLEEYNMTEQSTQYEKEKRAFWKKFKAFQGEITMPERTKEVTVRTRNSQYKFKYAPLDAVMNHVRPVLQKVGLLFSYESVQVEGGIMFVCQVIDPETGFCGIRNTQILPLATDEPPQDIGSIYTYFMRYLLMASLSLAPEDEDVAGMSERLTERKKKTQRKAAPKTNGEAETDSDAMTELSAIAADESMTIDERRTAMIEHFNDLDAATKRQIGNAFGALLRQLGE